MKMHKGFKSFELQGQSVTLHLLLTLPAKYSELKSSWPPEPIGHGKSWRTNRNTSHLPRPPPGLSSQKQPWSGEGPWMPRTWGGGASGTEPPFKTGTTRTVTLICEEQMLVKINLFMSRDLQSGAMEELLRENHGCYCETSRHRCVHSLTHTHTLSHTYTHTLSLSLSHTHTHSLSLSHTYTHTHTHTHTHSLSHSHTHTLSLTHTHTHSLSHIHTHSLSLSHTHTLSLSLTHTHTHTHSLSHTYTHTLSLSHIYTHTLSLSHTHTLLFKYFNVFKRSLFCSPSLHLFDQK